MHYKANTMKNLTINFLFVIFLSLISCTKEDKFEGTPSLNGQEIETIKGTVVSNTSFALPGQTINFTATLPIDFINKVNQEISVEVQTKSISGSSRRTSIKFPKGQNVMTGKVLVGGDGTFFMPVYMKLNAVKLTEEIAGKHYLLTSDDVIIDSGSTSVPVDDDSRLQIKIAWENKTTGNNFLCSIARVGSTAVSLKGSLSSSAKITISGTQYPFTFDTDLTTTATNFVTTYAAIISANKNIIVTKVGKAIFFKYVTLGPPVITIASTTTPANARNLGGSVFNSFIFSAGSDSSKEYPILNSQLSSTTVVESQAFAFNEGDFVVSIKPSVLEIDPSDVKYRIIIKQPNGDVLVSNGTFIAASATSSAKKVLTFSKTGYGDSAVYNQFVFIP